MYLEPALKIALHRLDLRCLETCKRLFDPRGKDSLFGFLLFLNILVTKRSFDIGGQVGHADVGHAARVKNENVFSGFRRHCHVGVRRCPYLEQRKGFFLRGRGNSWHDQKDEGRGERWYCKGVAATFPSQTVYISVLNTAGISEVRPRFSSGARNVPDDRSALVFTV